MLHLAGSEKPSPITDFCHLVGQQFPFYPLQFRSSNTLTDLRGHVYQNHQRVRALLIILLSVFAVSSLCTSSKELPFLYQASALFPSVCYTPFSRSAAAHPNIFVCFSR